MNVARWLNCPATIQTLHLKGVLNTFSENSLALWDHSTTTTGTDFIWQTKTRLFAFGESKDCAGFAGHWQQSLTLDLQVRPSQRVPFEQKSFDFPYWGVFISGMAAAGVMKNTVGSHLKRNKCCSNPLFLSFQDSLCCSYHNAVEKMSGFDCIQIPGAVKATVPGFPTKSNICGNRMNLPQATTCSEFPVSCLWKSFPTNGTYGKDDFPFYASLLDRLKRRSSPFPFPAYLCILAKILLVTPFLTISRGQKKYLISFSLVQSWNISGPKCALLYVPYLSSNGRNRHSRSKG